MDRDWHSLKRQENNDGCAIVLHFFALEVVPLLVMMGTSDVRSTEYHSTTKEPLKTGS